MCDNDLCINPDCDCDPCECTEADPCKHCISAPD